jgi:zinc protease
LAEAFYFNNQSITRDLQSRFPQTLGKTIRLSEHGKGTEALERMNLTDRDEAGMLWDRDVVAFYGDPALRVTLDPARNTGRTKFTLTETDKRYRFEATTVEESKGMVAMFFPHRIKGKIEVVAGKEFAPIITDNFIIIPEATLKPGQPLRVEFTAAFDL